MGIFWSLIQVPLKGLYGYVRTTWGFLEPRSHEFTVVAPISPFRGVIKQGL